jgi:hypothetical protein
MTNCQITVHFFFLFLQLTTDLNSIVRSSKPTYNVNKLDGYVNCLNVSIHNRYILLMYLWVHRIDT